MRILIRSYDLDDVGGSGITLQAVGRFLQAQGDTVWATNAPHTLDEVRAWAPDIIVGQQWATEEASEWATRLRVPFVMLVHGPGQFEQFMPPCDLVVFNTHTQHELARPALGRTPAIVLHPPVFRRDYETEGAGSGVTMIGSGVAKGVGTFLGLVPLFPCERFLLVTSDTVTDAPPNLEVVPKNLDVKSIYARTRLLLMPSAYESYGRVAVEAAMSGIPTIATDLPGIREATAGHALLVGFGESWEIALRGALDTLEERRRAARQLADLRDPAAELVALGAAFEAVVASGRRRPTLTLCMTVANEAHTLENAVESVASVADEIVIGVDRKSSDDTAAIARRLATRCFEFDEGSPPDFPRMRNRAMELVTTDWALVLDGHEWIEHADRIPGALETTAWSIEIRTLYEPDENRIPGLAFPFPRIHRRHVRFAGAGAHEEVATPLDRRDSRLDIHVWHERRPGAAATVRANEKSHGELDVLRAAWTERRDRRALFYLANGLKDAGCHDDAISCYETYLDAPNFPEEGWQALLYLGRCRAARREWDAAKQSFERAVLSAPERAEGLFGLAHVLLAEGHARPASSWFRMAASLPEPIDCRMFVEVPIYRWAAWHGLALALDCLGDYAGAAEAEARARDGGAGAWAIHNIDLWRARVESAGAS